MAMLRVQPVPPVIPVMATLKDDLLTVAKTAWAILSDDSLYDSETRAVASDLWLLALEQLRNHERRQARLQT